jgi:hypothetical protein
MYITSFQLPQLGQQVQAITSVSADFAVERFFTCRHHLTPQPELRFDSPDSSSVLSRKISKSRKKHCDGIPSADL